MVPSSTPKKAVFAALFVFVALVSGRIDAGEPSEVPLLLPAPGEAQASSIPGELPNWVSARAIRGNGSPDNWVLLPLRYQQQYETAHRNRLEDIESARAAGNLDRAQELASCPEEPTQFFRSGHGRHNRSLSDLALHAEAIYRGTVRARDAGFIQGRLGSLLMIDIEKTIKAPEGRPVPQWLFFEYPFADFRIGERLFCLRPDRTPAVPEVGDSVLFFVLFPPSHGLTVGSRSEEILFETAAGTLSLPSQIGADPGARGLETLAAAEERVLQLLATDGGQKGGAR